MGSTAIRPAREGVGSGTAVVKRRACDECRSRKLACTKEPDGCARCSRDGAACFYSTQKRMGRPKKIRNAGKAPQISPTAPAAPAPAHAPAGDATVSDDVKTSGAEPLMDPNLITKDTSFLDLLAPNSILTEPYQATLPDLKDNPLQQAWNFDIDFDHDPQPLADGTEVAPTGLTPGDFNTPSLSSQGASPTKEVQQPREQSLASLPPGSCGCLASLYLALDSLTHLPSEVEPAIRVARNATKAAHETVMCQVCSPPLTETLTVPISAYQNMMILGALLPSIAHAYQRILDMVETETIRAVCERRQVRFTLPGYGGVWGRLMSSERVCGATERYNDVSMEPTNWRLLVRALLKTDIYGIHFDSETAITDMQGRHLGLKDIVVQMDEKSKARHAEIDSLIEAGLVLPTSGPACISANHSHSRLVEPHCRKIIKIAKDAVDSLVVA